MSAPPKNVKTFTFMREYVNCGKASCGTCGGREFKHGPYWYAYSIAPKTGKTRKTYVGADLAGWKARWNVTSKAATPKTPTAETLKAKAPKTSKATPKNLAEWNRMLKHPTPMLAGKLLGVKPGITKGILTCAYKEAIRVAHPDKGGNTTHAAAINAAFALLKKVVK